MPWVRLLSLTTGQKKGKKMKNEIDTFMKFSKSDLVYMIGMLVNKLKIAQDFQDREKIEQLILKHVTALARKE